MRAECASSQPHFLHFIPHLPLVFILSLFPFSLKAEQLGRLTAQSSSTARQPRPPTTNFYFLFPNRGLDKPLLLHLSCTQPQGPPDFFVDFLVAQEMLICIVESDGQGKRLQLFRFLCLPSLLPISVCVAGAPVRQQTALRRTGTHTLSQLEGEVRKAQKSKLIFGGPIFYFFLNWDPNPPSSLDTPDTHSS